MNIPKSLSKHALTALVVVIAALAVTFKYWEFINNPWTRDGVVQADVIEVTPRVSGPIIELPIRDNQAVKAGDLLFRIDPRTYQAALDQAQAEAVRTQADFERGLNLVAKGDLSQRDFDRARADNDVARANLESAKLNLEFTEIRASVDGYITNLDVRIGSQAVQNQPVMALVDTGSFRVDGHFRETIVARIKSGDKAKVTLMSYPDTPLTGTVESVGWGIAREDGTSGSKLLPSVKPNFEWIRLAQRVPVRVHLDPLPSQVQLRVGTSASVLVHAGD